MSKIYKRIFKESETYKNDFITRYLLKKAKEQFNTFNRLEFNYYKKTFRGFAFGYEPSKKWEELFIIYFDFFNKKKCYIERGIEIGDNGEYIKRTKKFYKDYKLNSKFKKFIDEFYTSTKIFF